MVVIKKPHSDDVLVVFLKEAKLLPEVKHETIVQLAVNDEPVSIVMEYVLRFQLETNQFHQQEAAV